MINKIKICFAIFKVSFALLISAIRDNEFLYYPEGSTKKFKLFGKQYIKQARYEKSGKESKSKSVTYITALSKSFSGEQEARAAEFKELLKYTFLWYVFSEYMEIATEEDVDTDAS